MLVFSPNKQYGGLEKNPESVNKKQADPGNDVTITDLNKPLNIKKLKFQIPAPNTNKVTVFYSVLLIPDLLILFFFLDFKQVQGCGIVCVLIVL